MGLLETIKLLFGIKPKDEAVEEAEKTASPEAIEAVEEVKDDTLSPETDNDTLESVSEPQTKEEDSDAEETSSDDPDSSDSDETNEENEDPVEEEDQPAQSEELSGNRVEGILREGEADEEEAESDRSEFHSDEPLHFEKTDGKARVLSVINQKGGVGKSTTAINLSVALGKKGKKVLLVDFDPQGNSTSGLGIDKKSLESCVYDVLIDELEFEDVCIESVAENVDLVPATINLAGAEVELVTMLARESRLQDAVEKVREDYDYIFVDCPPSLGILTVNAFVAADQLLIPIQCEFYALEGVTKLLDSVKLVKKALNPDLGIFGILLTMYDSRTTLSNQVSAEVRDYFGTLVFETVIPRTVKLSESPSFGKSILDYDPTGKGSKAYKDLAEEVVSRG